MRIPILPPPGLNSDDTSFSETLRYVDADNIRFLNGRPQVIGGWTKYSSTQLNGLCRNSLAWYDLNGSLNIAFGTHTKLYVMVGGTIHDITPVGLASGAESGAGGSGFGAGDYGEGDYGEGNPLEYFPRTWSLGAWGQNLIASPRNGTIYVWENNTASPATEITQAPDHCTAVLVTPMRQIIAFGCNEEVSGTFNSRIIRGCNFGDYTDWATNSDDNVFEDPIEVDGGNIVTARIIGEYIGVWTDKSVLLGQYVGSPDQVYAWDVQTGNAGVLAPNSVQILNKRAWWVTPDYQFYAWAPGEAPQIVPCPIRDDFKNHIATGQYEKIAATSIAQYNEIWWFYPDSRDGSECSRYVSLKLNTSNPNEDAYQWSRGTLARSSAIDSGATRNPVFVSTDGYVYSHEDGRDANGGALEWSFSVALPYLDEGGRFVVIKGIEPDIKDQIGAVSATLTLRKYPQSTARTKGPYTLAPNAERKHFLASGRLGVVKFSGNSAPTFARFGKPVLLAEPTAQE